jgi:hypothetical protein
MPTATTKIQPCDDGGYGGAQCLGTSGFQQTKSAMMEYSEEAWWVLS